ncbi:MAG: Flp pilus assembly protein CpaB [Planctomycetota bacterium]|nr:MAG: Flp pilus assembly protein CpaB [Planctomycetota bacterium]
MKSKIPLFIALLLGLFAMFAVYTLMDQKNKQGQGVMVNVAIAKQDIPKGTKLSSSHFRWFGIPKSIYDHLSNVLIREDEIEDFVDQKYVRQDIKAKEFILKSHFWGTLGEESGDVVAKLTNGTRAISIPVNFIEGVSGLLKVGDQVDIIGTFELDVKGYGNYIFSCVLFSDKTILAVDSFSKIMYMTDQDSNKKRKKYGSVTLLMRTDEMVPLVFALNNASSLQLALKRKEDTTNVMELPPVDLFDILIPRKIRIMNHPIVSQKFKDLGG